MSSPSEVDPLAHLYEEESEEADPLAHLYAEEEVEPAPKRDEDKNFSDFFFESAPVRLAQSLASGATLGLTENVGALKPVKEDYLTTAGKLAGSLAPISRIHKAVGAPLVELAAKSPIAKSGLTAVANIFGWGATGAAVEGLETIAKGEIPTAGDLAAHGVVWGAMDAGLQALGMAGRFGRSLIRSARSKGVTPIEELREVTVKAGENLKKFSDKAPPSAQAVAEEAMKILREEPGAGITGVELRNTRIDRQEFQDLANESGHLAETYNPGHIEFAGQMEALEKEAIAKELDAVAPRAASEQELGKQVQESIEKTLKERQDEYKPLYDVAEEAATVEHTIPFDTAKSATEKLRDIESIATKPEGYSTVIRTIETVLKDAGFNIRRDEAGKVIESVSEKNIPVSQLMELGRRLNKIINYDVVEKGIRDSLRPIVKAVKRDIRTGLEGNADALAAFELAEEAHAKTAEKYSTDVIRKLRGQKLSEKIATAAQSPSVMQSIRDTVSPDVYARVEREVLERMNHMTHAKAAEYYRNIVKQLTEPAQKAAKELLAFKAPSTHAARVRKVQTSVLDEMGDALATGTRPKKTLELWKTQEGRRIIRDSLRNNPNRGEIERYLETQSTRDWAKSFIEPDGRIDFKKFNELIKDPNTVYNLRAMGGEDAVRFFRDMQRRAEGFHNTAKVVRQSKITEKPAKVAKFEPVHTEKPPTQDEIWRQKVDGLLGTTGKVILHSLAAWKLSLPVYVKAMVIKDIMYKLVKSSRLRQAFNDMTRKRTRPDEFLAAVKAFEDVYEQENANSE